MLFKKSNNTIDQLIKYLTLDIILDEDQQQQKTQGDVEHGGKVAKGTKESRGRCINNRKRFK